jgi:hypothetical protein
VAQGWCAPAPRANALVHLFEPNHSEKKEKKGRYPLSKSKKGSVPVAQSVHWSPLEKAGIAANKG